MDTGLFIIRVVVGLTLAAHGVQKLFGWLDGPGIRSTGHEFARLGYRRPVFFAVMAGAAETGGGVLLTLGLLVPFASAAIVGAMLSALLAAHLKNGFWIYNQGFEYTFVLAAVSAGLAFTGAGALSLDALLGFTRFGDTRWAVVAVAVGALAALAAEVYRRRGVAANQRLDEVSPGPRRAA
jgi:putative oxidoreductase